MKSAFAITFIFAIIALAMPGHSEETGAARFALDATKKGWQSFNEGDLDTALKRFHQATVLDPNFAPGYYGKAYVYSLQNHLALAIENYRKTIELADPPYTHAYGNLGLALLMTGEVEDGLRMVEKALEIDPGNGDAQMTLVNYYCLEKEGQLAREHLDKAIRLGVEVDPKFVAEMDTACP